jgi:RsiW-degrading membrane proteinase PrsW (M82 family)
VPVLNALAGLLGPLFVAFLVGRIAKLPDDPQIWLRFSGGVATAFVALICERYAFQPSRLWFQTESLIAVEAFLFVGLPEEIAKLALIYGAIISSRNVEFRSFVMVGLIVSAGFSGAENALYVLHVQSSAFSLVIMRMATAVPFHLSNSIIATFLLCKARANGGAPIYVVAALAVSILLHGLYDYLLMTDQLRSGKFLFPLFLTIGIAFRLLRMARSTTPPTKQP